MTSPRATGERMVPSELRSAEDQALYLRQLFAYHAAATMLPGQVRLLEAGVGEGYGARFLAECQFAVVGVDVDPTTTVHAARQVAARGCSFSTATCCDLPFRRGAFGAAVSFQVIEHVEDDARFVAELARAVDPAGKVLLTTPNRALRLAPGERPWNRFHRREYSAQSLRDLLHASFSRVEVLGIDAAPAVRRLELDRVARIRRLVSMDRFGLRRAVPDGLRRFFRATGYRIGLREGSPGSSPSLSIADWFVTDDAEQGLDLLAVCSVR